MSTLTPFVLQMLRVRNFKAVRDSGFVPLGPLTVFIGNNGSGKSSLIEGLETYQQTVIHGVDAALDRWLGYEHILNKRSSHRRQNVGTKKESYENPVEFLLKGRAAAGAFQASIVIAPNPSRNHVRIDEEFLKLPPGRLTKRNRDGLVTSYREKARDRISQVDPGESAAPPDWVDLLKNWQFLCLVPATMGFPEKQRQSAGGIRLNRDGSNIGQYLFDLRAASIDAFNGVLEALQYVLPYAADIQAHLVDQIERQVYLEMTEEKFKVPGWTLSTGTMRVLAILALLRHPKPPPLLVIEEIENGLDPRTIELIVSEIQEAITAGTTQVIATTHSPYLLDLLDLSHLITVDRVDGEPTFTRPADQKSLKNWADRFTPGKLYTMGNLTRGGCE